MGIVGSRVRCPARLSTDSPPKLSKTSPPKDRTGKSAVAESCSGSTESCNWSAFPRLGLTKVLMSRKNKSHWAIGRSPTRRLICSEEVSMG